MKVKTVLAAICVGMASTLLSCGGSSSNGVFGELPQLYEDVQIAVFKKIKGQFGGSGEEGKESDGLKILAMMKEAVENADEKAKPLAEAMKGKTIPFTQSDSLPYRIVSDIVIKNVKLPSFNLAGSDDKTKLEAEFDIVLKDTLEGKYVTLSYFLSGEEGNISTGYETVLGGKKVHSEQVVKEGSLWPVSRHYMLPGDTLHVEAGIYAPDAPAQVVGRCQTMNFDTRYAVDSQRKALKEQLKKWNEEQEKELDLD